MKTLSTSTVIVLLVALTAIAGPEFDEGSVDTGQQTGDARQVAVATTTAFGAITLVKGQTGSGTSGGTCPTLGAVDDPIDLFEVKFTSTTGWTIACDPGWDVELFLFEQWTIGGFPVGYKLIAAADDTLYSCWPGPLCWSERASISAGNVTINLARRHFVAVTGRGAIPGSYVNDVWQPCIVNQPLNWTGILNGGDRFFNDWMGTVVADGPYSLDVQFAPFFSDECSAATSLLPGLNPFQTTSATTSTTGMPTACAQIQKDVWFNYVPPCENGHFYITTCGHANWDTVLVAYNHMPTCVYQPPTFPPTGSQESWCDDDSCGSGSGLQSELSFDVVGCDNLLVRVGGYQGASGTGDLELVFLPSRDINDNGSVDAGDLATMLVEWGAGSGCTDLDANGLVDGGDLALLLGAWGSSGS